MARDRDAGPIDVEALRRVVDRALAVRDPRVGRHEGLRRFGDRRIVLSPQRSRDVVRDDHIPGLEVRQVLGHVALAKVHAIEHTGACRGDHDTGPLALRPFRRVHP